MVGGGGGGGGVDSTVEEAEGWGVVEVAWESGEKATEEAME